jgi:hypothetical protein
MKHKATRRWWCIGVLLGFVVVPTVGYNSASLSLDACDSAVKSWLPKGAPTSAQQAKLRAEPATLCLPFVAKVSFSKEFYFDPYTVQVERGTRYYFTMYGLVIPFWTSLSQKYRASISGP